MKGVWAQQVLQLSSNIVIVTIHAKPSALALELQGEGNLHFFFVDSYKCFCDPGGACSKYRSSDVEGTAT